MLMPSEVGNPFGLVFIVVEPNVCVLLADIVPMLCFDVPVRVYLCTKTIELDVVMDLKVSKLGRSFFGDGSFHIYCPH